MQMTDNQVFVLAIAIIFPISSLIYSNSRITDVRVALQKSIQESKETLQAQIKSVTDAQTALKETLRAEMQAMKSELSSEIKAGFDRIENALKTHELERHA
jgi:hypothetical protein